MNKPLIFVGVLFLLLGLFFLWPEDRTRYKNYPSDGTGVIAFGDSLVEGVGSTSGNDLFSLLSRRIDKPIANFGRGGDTTEMALERLPKVLEAYPRPELVIVLLGGNDFLRKIPKEQTFANLSHIITAFQERGAVVLVLGIRGGIFKDNFEEGFENVVEAHGAAYVPNVLSGLLGRREYMYDSIHPNDRGYEKIAERVHPILTDLLNQ